MSLAGNASEADLDALANACEAATFGRSASFIRDSASSNHSHRNQEDVLDLTYRKAGKLDRVDFALNLDIVQSGILEAARRALFDWEDTVRPVRAELYKLNVYGA